MSQTVWVVMPVGYDDFGIYGVYASLEAAKASRPQDTFKPDENGSYVNDGSTFSMGSRIAIEPWEVKSA